jgi:hypothetical protein
MEIGELWHENFPMISKFEKETFGAEKTPLWVPLSYKQCNKFSTLGNYKVEVHLQDLLLCNSNFARKGKVPGRWSV